MAPATTFAIMFGPQVRSCEEEPNLRAHIAGCATAAALADDDGYAFSTE